jgi:hypothetical protein
VALILILLALLGFGALGSGSGSTGSGGTQHFRPHRVHQLDCKARMSTGESRRDCGGPPANP